MGRVKARRGRRNPIPAPIVRIVIATAPVVQDRVVALRNEVQLAKAALLYADQVELVSPGTEMLGSFALLAAGGPESLIEVIESLDPDTLQYLYGSPQLPEGWGQFARLALQSEDQDWDTFQELTGVDTSALRDASASARAPLLAGAESMYRAFEEMMRTSGAEELEPALLSGQVQVRSILATAGSTRSEDITNAYADTLKDLLRQRDVYLLLDEQMGALAQAMLNEGVVQPAPLSERHASQALLGSGLVARLPAFGDARMEEVLALREELDAPLQRYRASVLVLAQNLGTHPFSAEAQMVIDEIHATVVRPAVDDLQSAMESNGLVRAIARNAGLNVGTLVGGAAGAALTLGLASRADIGLWIAGGLAAALPVVGTVVDLATDVAHDRSQARSATSQDGLFYLYEVDRRLS